MIEKFLERLIQELGPTGILVIGLYLIMYQPMRRIATHLEIINKEIGEIRDLMLAFMAAGKKESNDFIGK